jgi:chromosome segregation ATPase
LQKLERGRVDRLPNLEEGRIDTLCTSMEAQDAAISSISTRLKILEEGAVSQLKKFESDLAALREQHGEDLLKLRNDINKKQIEELLEIRNEQQKQELQAERLVSIVTELEQLYACTKQDLQHEQLNAACQEKFNELQVWANHQVQNLETEMADLRSSLDKCMPLGTLVLDMQRSIAEHRRCHDSLKEQVETDLERFEKEKDQLREEIAPLKIDVSGLKIEVPVLDQKMQGYVIKLEGYTEQQEKRLSQAESNASNAIQSFQDVQALCVGLDQKLESHIIQAEGCKEDQERRLSQAESNVSNAVQSCQDVQALCDKLASAVPAADPTGRSQIACLDADLDLLRCACEEQANIQKKVREAQAHQQRHLIALDAALMKLGGGHKADSAIINDAY